MKRNPLICAVRIVTENHSTQHEYAHENTCTDKGRRTWESRLGHALAWHRRCTASLCFPLKRDFPSIILRVRRDIRNYGGHDPKAWCWNDGEHPTSIMRGESRGCIRLRKRAKARRGQTTSRGYLEATAAPYGLTGKRQSLPETRGDCRSGSPTGYRQKGEMKHEYEFDVKKRDIPHVC